MRIPFLFGAVLALSACSPDPTVPTAAQASAALQDTYRLQQVLTQPIAPDLPRTDSQGNRIVLTPAVPQNGNSRSLPRSADSPPTVPQITEVDVVACDSLSKAVVCEVSYRLAGSWVRSDRVRFWRGARGIWRARRE